MIQAGGDLPVVVVTGSSGFIGFALCERLADRARVVGLDRPGAPHPPHSSHCIEADLTSDESVREAFADIRAHYGNRIAAIFHLAAFYDFAGRESPMYEKLTVRGTARLLAGAREFDVECFVFSSTMLVHRPCRPGERITEDAPIAAKWAYPQSKIEAESVIRRERGAMPAVLWRMAGVYNDRCHSIPIAHQIQRIFERQFTGHFFAGDLSAGQSFIHLDDVIDMAEAIFDHRTRLKGETALLAGEEETLSYGELQRSIARLVHDRKWRTLSVPKPLAKLGAGLMSLAPFGRDPFIRPWMMDIADDHYALDMSRARRLLEWEPKRFLRSTLPRMVELLKQDPAVFYRENNLEAPAWLAEWRRTRENVAGRRRPEKKEEPVASRRE